MQELIRYHSEKGTVGIHPSWQSTDNPKLLKQEIGWLEFITGQTIMHSRQHFIRLNLPQTYRHLIAAGVQKDFSMGYGTINGFRASVASSFYWYDLEKEETTGLMVFPFCFMDANAFYEEKLAPHQALAELMRFYQIIKQVNGDLFYYCLFFPESFVYNVHAGERYQTSDSYIYRESFIEK